MEDWQKRVIQEQKELDEKRDKLDKFLVSSNFFALDSDVQKLMRQQSQAMEKYSSILRRRIVKFSA